MITEQIDAQTENANAYVKRFRLLEAHVHLAITKGIDCMDMEKMMTSSGNWLLPKENVLEMSTKLVNSPLFLIVLHFAKVVQFQAMPQCLPLEPMTTTGIVVIRTILIQLRDVIVCVKQPPTQTANVALEGMMGTDCIGLKMESTMEVQ